VRSQVQDVSKGEDKSVTIEELERLASGEGWPPSNAVPLSEALLENFASPDSRIRDTLSFTLMDRLIEEGLLTLRERVALLQAALDDRHLFAGIGESGTDRVFRRSFSVLLVPLVLGSDLSAGELPEDLVVWALDRVLAYARAERDWRGYVPGKGWAHAVAHTADALGIAGRHPKTPYSRLPDLLSAIHYLATIPYPLGYREDDRLALAAYQIIQSGRLGADVVRAWLDRFQLPTGSDDQAATLGGANAEHVLRSLYFRFRAKDREHAWLEPIQTALDRLDIFLLYPPPEI
jgi:hypothetical protein